MKNIHVLATDKPSRLSILNNGKLNFGAEFISSSNSKAQNIYITNDEEIKEGDWYLFFIDETPDLLQCEDSSEANRCNGKAFSIGKASKKIILTTNQDLINDGVQEIDNKFLEWFVKNQNCEEVEVEKIQYNPVFDEDDLSYDGMTAYYKYKIIIPKEETERGITITHVGKQETLEQVAKECLRNNNLPTEGDFAEGYITGSIFGAKWQQETMYSEEEVKTILFHRETHYIKTNHHLHIDNWFEQFKKK